MQEYRTSNDLCESIICRNMSSVDTWKPDGDYASVRATYLRGLEATIKHENICGNLLSLLSALHSKKYSRFMLSNSYICIIYHRVYI